MTCTISDPSEPTFGSSFHTNLSNSLEQILELSAFSLFEKEVKEVFIDQIVSFHGDKSFLFFLLFFVFVFLHSQKTTDLITSKTAEKRQKSKTYPTESSHFLSLSQYNLFSQIIFLANDVVVQSCF